MSYESKEGSGALFRNDKGGVESRPDYRGDCKVNGTVYEISGWLKEGREGKPKWMSLSIKPKGERGAKAAPKSEERRVADAFADDDLPPF